MRNSLASLRQCKASRKLLRIAMERPRVQTYPAVVPSPQVYETAEYLGLEDTGTSKKAFNSVIWFSR
jgi:hypothetical protein